MDNIIIFRHYLATLAYRSGHALNNATDEFKNYKSDENSWTTFGLLEHMVQLIGGSLLILKGEEYDRAPIENWDGGIIKYFDNIKNLDSFIVENGIKNEKLFASLFQGPILDAMTHVGQLMMIHRLCGKTLESKPYWKVEIEIGKFIYDY